MQTLKTRALRRTAFGVFAATLLAGSALAGPTYLTPNTTTGLGPTTLDIGGQTFINKGLVGAGRLANGLTDFNGETLGSFSGMAVVPGTWTKTADGYSGTIYTLPDRGYNSGTVFSDYGARLQTFNINFKPYTDAANLPQSPASQNQLTFDYQGGILLKDFNGNPMTGNNPGSGTVIQDGHVLPTPLAGQLGAGKISIDSEAVAITRNGNFYVGDEYTGGVYYFDKTGQMLGFIDPVTALQPAASGTPNYGVDLNNTGRRSNQGMEGVSVSPDGNKLFAVLQSATLQDSAADQSTRKNTRVLVYDISSDATPDAPIGHYVLELPVFDRDGTGGAADRTAAQSEVLLLNDHQFLLLTRDGNGLGVDDGRPIVFKSIFLVDITGATNLIGTQYENTATPLPVLNAAKDIDTAQVTPVTTGELVNMLNTDQLAHLGLTNAVVAAHPVLSTNLLSEKWESFGLVSVFDPLNPDDYFLFVGNDNDFSTLDGVMSAVSNPNGTPSGTGNYNSGVINDSMILVYRVTLPTYEAAAVPEPASIALLVSGLAGAWGFRRRRKNKA